MPTKLNFKMGKENRLPSSSNMTSGTVYFTSDGSYGKIWFKDADGKSVNIVPDVLDGGSLGYTFIPECCFVKGTQVLLNLNGNTKNIEDIQAGDIVLSYNIFTDKFYEVLVQKLIINRKTTNLAKVYFDNGLTLEMNEYHPLYSKEGFHSLTNHNNYDTLEVGDEIKTFNGWSKIIKIEQYHVNDPIITYNLATKDFSEEIDDDTNDTFIVNGFVVHNATACPT